MSILENFHTKFKKIIVPLSGIHTGFWVRRRGDFHVLAEGGGGGGETF